MTAMLRESSGDRDSSCCAQQPARLMPGAGHLVHMPSHIDYRLGMYREALRSNVEAVAIDERYFSASPSDPVYRGACSPHNIHFMLVSALMGGDGKTALEAARRLGHSRARACPDRSKGGPPLSSL